MVSRVHNLIFLPEDTIFISKRIHATEPPSLTSEYKTCKFWSFLKVLIYISPTQPNTSPSHGHWPHSKVESHKSYASCEEATIIVSNGPCRRWLSPDVQGKPYRSA